MFLGGQPCATVEEYRRDMAELVDRGRKNLRMKKVGNRHCCLSASSACDKVSVVVPVSGQISLV